LFATDVLSEGQNLQDAAYLINYDLHWNPVRMIQRNGRINRLGSNFDKVMIGNMKPGEDLELYLNLVHRLENKIKTIRNTVGLDQGILDDRDINPIEFIEKYYEKGELPEVDDDLLAHTDEHILALRRFLGENLNNQKEILRVQSIPKGKWNYLPSESRKHSNTLALVKVNGETLNSHQSFEDLFFVEVSTKNEKYLASYLDYPKALDRIKADPSENHKIEDVINIDRSKVKSRASAEAKRQANNPESRYTLTPQYLNALGILVPYFSSEIDFKGVIETGVSTIDVQARLESVLRKVRSEHKNNGTIYASTLKEFEDIFNEIKDNVVEEKEVRGIEISLYYAGLI
jgi:superfamily II DNA/RNA helicase